ncbi:MAG: Lrp/AsnC family transcriptional regulator [Candidatus Verstraetearchaeota archaeon]|nr:Lrp/AsnC family transcriptional regulator [Candidatus Verstraetearchaeota archaeon]
MDEAGTWSTLKGKKPPQNALRAEAVRRQPTGKVEASAFRLWEEVTHSNRYISGGHPMREIDEIDQKILAFLKDNARVPFTKIADEVGLSEAAVRKRVERLQEDGIIKRFTVEVDTGEKVRAAILVSVQPSHPNPVIAQAVKKIAGIDQVFEVAGEVDIIAIASGRSIQEINKYIDEVRRIEGVAKTSSMIVLRSWV